MPGEVFYTFKEARVICVHMYGRGVYNVNRKMKLLCICCVSLFVALCNDPVIVLAKSMMLMMTERNLFLLLFSLFLLQNVQ